jgi:deoxycytidylate deaminase
MRNTMEPVEFPELIFATAGPIGVDMDTILATLKTCLSEVNYSSEQIKLSSEMERIPSRVGPKPTDSLKLYHWKIDYANALRKKFKRADVLARIGLEAIRAKRSEHGHAKKLPIPRMAYLLSQLKSPEEVELLRKVYGRQFILVSAYASETDRHHRLTHKLRTEVSTNISESELAFEASKLMERDASEGDKFGQRLRDTFHLGDVFIDGLEPKRMQETINRFIQALFGRNDITPSKDEYGMYAARSASLRSADLSRQVGAAIFSSNGEIVVQGCNEVPKAHGGTYWDLEQPDFRDIKKGVDPNEQTRREILRDLFERLRNSGLLSRNALKIGNDAKIVQRLTQKSPSGPLSNSRIMDLTEYGRIVHAEMSALCDAARLGKAVKGGILYCTTFPCHNCTKHILAAGIEKVVFLEPYPKSQAKVLHGDEVEIETDAQPEKVSFVPFLGISPYRYRDIFGKGRRKDDSGAARRWYLGEPRSTGEPRPLLDVVFPSYVQNEIWALAPIVGTIEAPLQRTKSRASQNRQPNTRRAQNK